jgi:MFS transporter, DHA3 family, tetracycline resistance protein
MAVYFIKVAHLQAFQLVILGTIFEVTIFLGEIPTGVVADVYSRKLSVTLSYILAGIAFLITGLSTPFLALAFGAVIWGISETFLSGAREAWIADELTAVQPEISADQAFITGNQYSLAGRFIGVWFAFAFSFISLRASLVAGAVGFLILGVAYQLLASEKGFHRAPSHSHNFGDLFQTLKDGFNLIKSRAALVAVVLTTFFVGFSSEAMDRLWQKRFLDSFPLPTVFNNPEGIWTLLQSGVMIGTIVVLAIVNRAKSEIPPLKLLGIITALVISIAGGMIWFGIAPTLPTAIIAFFAVRIARRALDPLIKAWLNRRAESNVRATVLSFAGQAHSFGEILSGPVLGSIAQLVSFRWAMFTSSALLLPNIPILFRRIAVVKSSDDPTLDS